LGQGTTLHRKKPNGDGISDEIGSASSYRVTRARRTGNLRAVQLLLGHTKIESTVRYLGIEIDDAIEVAEKTEV
jgi:hypothetical protein